MLEKFIPYSTQSIDDSDILAVSNALKSTHLTQGNLLKQFEDNISKFISVKYAVAFNSATSALYAAFRGIKELAFDADCKNLDSKLLSLLDSPNFKFAKKNKKISIITTPISFVATTNMMLENDITPIFVDINMNGNINTDKIEAAIRDDTLAICSVDYAGNSVNIDALKRIAKKHNLLWVSDSSHAFGASFNGEKVGNQADISIFSFHAVKPIATCEGGALVSNNEFFANLARLICSHGVVKKSLYNYDCVTLGFNFRLNELSAALGLSQMKRLESFITQREKIAQFYDEYFKDNPYFFTPDSIKISNLDSKDSKQTQSTRHLYPLLLEPKYICNKEQIANELNAQNVGVQVHYKPIYNFSLYQKFNYPLLRNAEDFYHSELSIPCHQNIDLTLAKQIADIILNTFEKVKC